ncbi:MAG: anti-sigma factor [Chloroflexi bacterium]|nr:anti-sigma factor [Chloroflexota bacterium]
MTCRRICRELLWLARFGEFGPSSQPHLDHLAGCASCRDEVGYDRAMVQQLRVALAERIEGMTPSPDVWQRILHRAQAAEPAPARMWSWSTAILARLRTVSAVTASGLALVLALNMEVVPVALPSASEPAPITPTALAAPTASFSDDQHLLVERPPLEPRPYTDAEVGGESIVPEPEGRVMQLDAPVIAQPGTASNDPVAGSLVTEIRVSFRSPLSPEPTFFDDTPAVMAEPIDVLPSVPEAGEPS